MQKRHAASALIAIVTLSISIYGFAVQAAPADKPPQAAAKATGPVQTFTGVISDGQCAAKGSHDEIKKKASVNTDANCVKGCARRYWYVLYNPATRKIYKLSDQGQSAEFAAKKVKVKGSLDKATQTINVRSIEPAS
jgi:hypothetical protein